ncbi:DUF5830 family protein [Halomarina ordinaria]|uniref:DUF5830 family protein n=1 Tax=Halomarina ordinaria TaxID=3033939 RepID=A0ABD5UBB7_9EURY
MLPASVPLSVTDETVELGVQLLERLEHEELSLAEAVDRLETVTTVPTTTRTILDEAEKRGVIRREDGLIRPTAGRFLRFESEVVTKEGEFTCKRCGASLSTGYFMRLEAGDHGPFGSSCIRKVTGRE